MVPVATRRGGPLVALGAVMGCWVAMRLAMVAVGSTPAMAGMMGEPVVSLAGKPALRLPAAESDLPVTMPDQTAGDAHERSAPPLTTPLAPLARPPAFRFEPFVPVQPAPAAAPRTAALPVSVAAGHQMMWMAALSRLPLPAGFAGAALAPSPPRAALAPFYPSGVKRNGPSHWSADGWVLLRRGANGTLAAGTTPATLGASQAGAVLRYRLSGSSAHRPQAYVRLAAALEAPSDKEMAAGLSVRPVPALPLRAMAELRVSDQSGRARLRPAALVVTELQPVDLPHGTRAEFYGQAGYVGGRSATAFADGQARIDRHVAQLGKAEFRAGAGTWAGVQKGAARVDAGPSATVGLPVGEGGSARLGLDWRLRVAGEAAPGSGLAVTLSAGF